MNWDVCLYSGALARCFVRLHRSNVQQLFVLLTLVSSIDVVDLAHQALQIHKRAMIIHCLSRNSSTRNPGKVFGDGVKGLESKVHLVCTLFDVPSQVSSLG